MKLQCLSENLNAALPLFNGVVPRKSTLSIIENVWLETDSGRLKVIGTNLESALIAWVGAKVEAEGTVTVPYKALVESIKGRKELITLEAGKDSATLTSDTTSVTLKGIESSEYPIVKMLASGARVECPYDSLLEGFKRVIHCAERDEARPVLNTVAMFFKKDTLTLVTADGYRLAKTEVQLDSEATEMDVMVTLSAAEVLIKILTFAVKNRLSDNVKITVDITGNQIGFDLGNLYLLSRMVEGKFPDYKAIVPVKKNAVTTLTGDAKGIASAALACKGYSDVNITRLTIVDGKTSLQARGAERGETSQSLLAEVTGENMVIGLNWKFLEDAMKAVNGTGKATIRLQSADKPVCIDSDNLVQVIMPMNIKE